jgi:hypothetical protein
VSIPPFPAAWRSGVKAGTSFMDVDTSTAVVQQSTEPYCLSDGLPNI